MVVFLIGVYFLTYETNQNYFQKFNFNKLTKQEPQADLNKNNTQSTEDEPVENAPAIKEEIFEPEIPIKEAPLTLPAIAPSGCILEALPNIAEKALPSVVSITSMQISKPKAANDREKLIIPGPFGDLFKEFFDFDRAAPRKTEAQGSGFIVEIDKENGTKEKVIVTNNHVVADAQEITITFHNRVKIQAKVLAKDQRSDIAILTVKKDHDKRTLNTLPALEWGDSSKCRVGQYVIAIGNPFGLGSTVTDGIISYNKGRDIPTPSTSKHMNILPDLIQHSAQINVGSSGGVLIAVLKNEKNELTGKAVGINTAIFTPSGGNVGVGFAIPSIIAKTKIESLIKYGRVIYGWLGVLIRKLHDFERDTYGIKQHGYHIEEIVPNSPAHKSGLKYGDIIVGYNGKDLTEEKKLDQIVKNTKPGEKIELKVYRGGNFKDLITINVTIEEQKDDVQEKKADKKKGEKVKEFLGLSLVDYEEDNTKGIMVTDTKNPIDEKLLNPGDIIIKIRAHNVEKDIKTVDEFISKVNELKQKGYEQVICIVKRYGFKEHGYRVLPLKDIPKEEK